MTAARVLTPACSTPAATQRVSLQGDEVIPARLQPRRQRRRRLHAVAAPSCSKMIAPVLVCFKILLTIWVAPGRLQSPGSTDQSIGRRPICAHRARTSADQAP